MKIFRGKFGWSIAAHSKTMEGEEIKYYLPVQFKKGYEPSADEIEGELVFRYKSGETREVFFSSYKKQDGTVAPKMVIKGSDKPAASDVVRHSFYTKDVQTTLGTQGRDVTGHIVDEDLPFL